MTDTKISYEQAMEEMGEAVADAVLAAQRATKAATADSRVTADELRTVVRSLEDIDRNVDTLISFGVTYEEFLREKRMLMLTKAAL